MLIKTLPQIATLNNKGLLKPDNDTIEINDGVLSVSQAKIVAQETGTDEEIVAMVEAADAGELDLTECQAVGDERTVHLNAITTYPSNLYDTHEEQDIIFTIVAMDTKNASVANPCYNYQFVEPTIGRTYPSIIVQQKNTLINTGYMDAYVQYPRGAGQSSYARRTQCNNQYKNALPSTLISIFKQVAVKFQGYAESSDYSTCNDYFFLADRIEIHSSEGYYNNGLSKQPYYNISANQIKDKSYQLRTHAGTEVSDPPNTCYYSYSGTQSSNKNNNNYGIAPCGCI